MEAQVGRLFKKIDIVNYSISKGILPVNGKYFVLVLSNGIMTKLRLNRWIIKQSRVSQRRVCRQCETADLGFNLVFRTKLI